MIKYLVTSLVLVGMMFAQTAPKTGPNTDQVPAFPSTTTSINFNPITLPGVKSSVAGMQTDVLIAPSNTFQLGPSTLVNSDMVFAGGKGVYFIQAVSNWIQNHSTNLNGYQWQFGLTGTLGVVKPVGTVGTAHWGESAGVVVNYAVNGTWGMGLDAEWINLPGVQHNGFKLGFGPNLHF